LPQPGLSGADRALLRASLTWRPWALRARIGERLAATYVHPSAEHARRLLVEPGLALRDVVAMSSRRPTTAMLLAEIAASPRWVAHAPVREALVFNPFTPVSIAVRLVPTLPLVRRVATAMELDARVREMARVLVA
jgi:hypothetical protein